MVRKNVVTLVHLLKVRNWVGSGNSTFGCRALQIRHSFWGYPNFSENFGEMSDLPRAAHQQLFAK